MAFAIAYRALGNDLREISSPAAILPSIAAQFAFATMAAQHRMSTSRLRKYRKTANLTQREVAALVGYASQRAYSDVELGIKRPALGSAIACAVLFNVSIHTLFPTLAGSIEQGLLARARKLHSDMARSDSRNDTALFISEIITRIGDAETRE